MSANKSTYQPRKSLALSNFQFLLADLSISLHPNAVMQNISGIDATVG